VTVNNATGCSRTSAATAVTVNANPAAVIAASGATTFCQGGNVMLTASAGSSYLWSNGATTQSITVPSSGTFSVAVTQTGGCISNSTSTNVTVNPLPTAAITAGGATSFCQGGNVVLTATTGNSWLWRKLCSYCNYCCRLLFSFYTYICGCEFKPKCKYKR
jgi:hypothetical protein